VSTQPILKWVFSDAIDKAVGIELSERQFPLRLLLDAGVHVSLSSDAPVAEPDWLQGVESAVLRRSKATSTDRGPQQRITAREALRLFTMGGAWQDHMERKKGSIEPGKLADFCVLDQNILSIPAEEIHAITNVGTVVGGRIVYDAGLRR
jgi:predicted amidohydrolase YtcJ